MNPREIQSFYHCDFYPDTFCIVFSNPLLCIEVLQKPAIYIQMSVIFGTLKELLHFDDAFHGERRTEDDSSAATLLISLFISV